ncbi:MAG TPA: hypothetical protein VF950_07750 [Planctomycetota bacterium]
MTRNSGIALLLAIPCFAACAPTDVKGWLERGDRSRREGDLAAAIEDYSEGFKLEDERGSKAQFLLRRGECRHQRKDFDGAIADFEEGLRFGRGGWHQSLVAGLAKAKDAKGDREGALNVLLDKELWPEPLGAGPANWECNHLLIQYLGGNPQPFFLKRAEAHTARGEFAAALEEIDWARRTSRLVSGLGPGLVDVGRQKVFDAMAADLVQKGDAHRAKGDLKLAHAAYTQALRVVVPQGVTGWFSQDVVDALGRDGESKAARERYETLNPAFAAVHPGLGAASTWKTGEVDGRKVVVQVARPAEFRTPLFKVSGNPPGYWLGGVELTRIITVPSSAGKGRECDDVETDMCFGLRDAVTGEVLLPLNWQRIEIVPGQGVYVYPVRKRLMYPVASGEIHKAIAGGVPPADGTFQWRRFDLKTREALPSDVLHIERHASGGLLVAKQTGRGSLTADVFPPGGGAGVHYENFRPILDNRDGRSYLLRSTGPVNLLRTSTKAGKDDPEKARTYILGPTLAPITELEGELVTLTNGQKRYYAAPAPGAKPEEDLWVLLEEKGTLSAGPGALGLRPFSHARWERSHPWNPTRWLVRFALPGEPGYLERPGVTPRRWGLAEWDFSKVSVPLWDVAELILPPTSGRQPTYVDAHGSTAYRPYSFYDRPVLLVGTEAEWTATSIDDPAALATPQFATGKTRQEALDLLVRRCEQAFQADQTGIAEFVAHEKARIAREKAEFERRWAAMSQGEREDWLIGAKSTDPNLWDQVALASASLRFQGTAWYHARGTPAKRLQIFTRWHARALASYDVRELAEASQMLYYHYGDKDGFSIPDKEKKWSQLYDLSKSRHPSVLEAEAKAAAAAIVSTSEKYRRRDALHTGYQPTGGSFSWTPPANPSQQRYDEEAYKRGLDQRLNGKTWTPFGY